MKDKKIFEIFKAKKDAPDISLFTDDLLGPSPSMPMQKIPNSIKLLNVKMKNRDSIGADVPDKSKLTPNFSKASEEENEEGELVSDKKRSLIKSLDKSPAPKSKPKEDNETPPRLSNREQAFQLGLNHDANQVANKYSSKGISPSDIPRIVTRGVGEHSHIIPTYRNISELPDNIRIPIQAMEESLFGILTSQDVNDIQVIANSRNQGPNSSDEFHAVVKWLNSVGHIDNSTIAPLRKKVGNIKLIHTNGITHLVVDNSGGQFIFSWPSIKNHLPK